MNSTVKIALWSGGILLASIGGVMAYNGIRRNSIRKCLDEAYSDPSSEKAVGGMDKLLVSEVFNERTFQTSGKATISRVEARERAKIIWDNYSAWFSSNPTAIIGAFSGLGHSHDVSKIAYEFSQSYGEELLSVLKTALGDNSSQYTILIAKIQKLPK